MTNGGGAGSAGLSLPPRRGGVAGILGVLVPGRHRPRRLLAVQSLTQALQPDVQQLCMSTTQDMTCVGMAVLLLIQAHPMRRHSLFALSTARGAPCSWTYFHSRPYSREDESEIRTTAWERSSSCLM
jgi:hypothetical protein